MSLILAFNANAAKQDKEKSIKEQVSEFKVDDTGTTTLSDKEMIEKVLRDGVKRDSFREEEQMSILEYNAINAKSDKLDKQRELIVQEFIIENVPSHIIASGDKAINAYVNENFSGQSKKEPSRRVSTLWESSTSAIAIPITNQERWTPSISIVTPVQSETPPSTTAADEQGLSDSDKNALAELGMTEADLKAMLGDDNPTKKDEPKEVKKEPEKSPEDKVDPQDKGHIVLDKIKVERVVIMGKSKFVDLNITFKQVIRGMQRTINKSFSNMEPGAIFQIENNQFELVSLNKNQIVFENLDTKKTFRELID